MIGRTEAERGSPRVGFKIGHEHYRLLANLVRSFEQSGDYEAGVLLREAMSMLFGEQNAR